MFVASALKFVPKHVTYFQWKSGSWRLHSWKLWECRLNWTECDIRPHAAFLWVPPRCYASFIKEQICYPPLEGICRDTSSQGSKVSNHSTTAAYLALLAFKCSSLKIWQTEVLHLEGNKRLFLFIWTASCNVFLLLLSKTSAVRDLYDILYISLRLERNSKSFKMLLMNK